MSSFDLREIERRMRGAFTVLKGEFGGLRTGRANASLLDPIMSPDQPLHFVVDRGGKTVDITVTPELKTITDRFGNTMRMGRLKRG